MLELPMTIVYLIAGALGGIVFHSYWLIRVDQETSKNELVITKELIQIRLYLAGLSFLTGAVAGLIVWVWFKGDLKDLLIAPNQIIVFCFIAGLSGDGLLGLLKRASQFGN